MSTQESNLVKAQRIRMEMRRKRRQELQELQEQLKREEEMREQQRKETERRKKEQSEQYQKELEIKIDPLSATRKAAAEAAADGTEAPAVNDKQVAMLLEKIDKLEERIVGQKNVTEQLAAAKESLEKEVASLKETLALYRSPSARKLAVAKTPDVVDMRLPDEPLPLPKIAVGSEVLARYSETEWYSGHVTEETPDEFMVQVDVGDSSGVSKNKVYPPMQLVLDVLADTARKEAAIRQAYAEMEAKYKAQVAGLKKELKDARDDYAKMKAVYGVDVRQMMLKRAEKNRPKKTKAEAETASSEEDEDEEDEDDAENEFECDLACNELVRPYSLECDVACYAAKVDEVDENRRAATRWYTAVGQSDDFWKQLSDQVDEVTQPNPVCHGRRARLFQLYHDGDTDDLELYQARAMCEKDLDPHRVSIIDTFNEVWVYVGSDATPDAEIEGTQAALGLAEHAQDGRSPDTPVVVVHQGKEPLRFRALFRNWRLSVPPEAEAEAEAEKEEGEDGKAVAKVDDMGNRTFTYKQLLERESLPADVDQSALDMYLSEDDFERVFGMRRSMFVALPEWKQTELRLRNRLF